ncbi:MAG: insulinase family protein [Bacteroidia bacterium]|nr:insulinase family protein [Bacteroidia bacterium]
MTRISKPSLSNEGYNLQFKPFEKTLTKQGVPFYFQSAGTQDVIKMELVFSGGIINQPAPGVASFTCSMLSEGTKSKSGTELVNALDYYGAYFQAKASEYDSVITLYCLSKHLMAVLPLLNEAIEDSIFPEKALNTLKRNAIERLKVNEQKSSFLCRREFNSKFFGNDHPLGISSSIEDINKIDIAQIIEYHQTYFLKGLKYILLSGRFEDSLKDKVVESINFSNKVSSNIIYPELTTQKGKFIVTKEKAVQSTIKLGHKGISRTHAYFPTFQLMNTILGGYFGSRLMKNIREDKGLTYGIYSSHETNSHYSLWYIESDLNKKNIEIARKEIFSEIAKIQTELVEADELSTAKNYLLGSILKSLDNNLSLSGRMKLILDNELNYDYLNEFKERILKATAEEIREIANQYLHINDLIEITVE